jgi:Rieske Fe-S protein
MTLWRPVPFVAEAMAPAKEAAPARRVLINGVLFRRGTPDDPASIAARKSGAAGSSSALSALCVTCPHEQCQVDLVTDEARLSRMSRGTANSPLFECGCHLSIFDAGADGARISGEAPRGLFRFRISGIDQGMVEISEIEEVALFEV